MKFKPGDLVQLKTTQKVKAHYIKYPGICIIIGENKKHIHHWNVMWLDGVKGTGIHEMHLVKIRKEKA